MKWKTRGSQRKYLKCVYYWGGGRYLPTKDIHQQFKEKVTGCFQELVTYDSLFYWNYFLSNSADGNKILATVWLAMQRKYNSHG